jgi:hypothetical protein
MMISINTWRHMSEAACWIYIDFKLSMSLNNIIQMITAAMQLSCSPDEVGYGICNSHLFKNVLVPVGAQADPPNKLRI